MLFDFLRSWATSDTLGLDDVPDFAETIPDMRCEVCGAKANEAIPAVVAVCTIDCLRLFYERVQ